MGLRQRDRQTGRGTDRQGDRQTDRETDRQRDRQTDRPLSQHVSAPAVPGGRSAGIRTRRRPAFALEPRGTDSLLTVTRPLWRWGSGPPPTFATTRSPQGPRIGLGGHVGSPQATDVAAGRFVSLFLPCSSLASNGNVCEGATV